MQPTIFYDAYSDTLRQAPQNYLLAVRKDRRWVCDADPACDRKLIVRLFLAVFVNYEIRYGDPEKVVDFIMNSNAVESIIQEIIF